MESPRILVIDDSQTILKMVECHLSQSGYRVVTATNAERGLELAQSLKPDLILLDHQLPGTTGDEVCRKLNELEATSRIPVVVSSAMRSRAFARYTEFPNVVDQIPKPFTPELLKSGVANALQMGSLVIQAQRTGCAMPEAVGEGVESALEGNTGVFPLRAVIDFLNNSQQNGRLTLEFGQDRYHLALAGGRIQAVFSPTFPTGRLAALLPADLIDVAPLLSITLGEHQDASMTGLVKLLERSLADPKRLRALLRFQSAVLVHQAMRAEAGKFVFLPNRPLPPMFQAFPLQSSLPALAIEGVRRAGIKGDLDPWRGHVFARINPRGGNPDRSGLSPTEMKIHATLDGSQDIATIATKLGLGIAEIVDVIRGLELAGLVERRNLAALPSILVLEDDPEAAHLVSRVLGPEGEGYPLQVVRDRVAAQLLMRRGQFSMVMLPIDQREQETFYRSCRERAPAATRFVGVVSLDDAVELRRVDALGLDAIIQRPITETDLRSIVKHLFEQDESPHPTPSAAHRPPRSAASEALNAGGRR